MYVVAILNPKGGSGKTTLATILARVMSDRINLNSVWHSTDSRGL